MMIGTAPARDAELLADMLGQITRSGAHRTAALLHSDRLPPGLAKPHHLRLAREALGPLAAADRARSFELSRGRLVVLWRGTLDAELAQARRALEHLLADQPCPSGELLTVYDLPAQAAWLADELTEAPPPVAPPGVKLDAGELACLEARLVQADLSRFTRWRAVMRLDRGAPALAWEERSFDVDEIAASLCPGHDPQADPWLLRRLRRTLDRRMLAMLAASRELRGCGTFALSVTTEAILSAAFVAFDAALPLALRGEVILNLEAADILADPDGYTFARRFAQARGYRLALAGATPALLRFFDVRAAALDIVSLACTAELMQAPGLAALVPDAACIVLTGLDHAARLDWAVAHGFTHGSGRALSL